MKICGLDLVYTLFVGSFYIVDLSQSRFGSFVYAHASDWFFSFLSHMLLLISPFYLPFSIVQNIWHVSCTSCVGS